MEIALGIATLIGGIAALWFFWDKVTAWFRPTSVAPAPSVTRDNALLQDLAEELGHNLRALDRRTFATTPALRDEAWVAAQEVTGITGALRSSLNTLYSEIRSARGVHGTIVAANSPNTMPEQLQLEAHLDAAAAVIPAALAGIRVLMS